MGKLRDWWPSEELPLPPHPKKPGGTAAAAAGPALRLSEVTAALNNDPPPPPPALASISAATAAAAPNLSRPVIKLCNSQQHKQELMRKLLGRSASTPDLPSYSTSTSASASASAANPPPIRAAAPTPAKSSTSSKPCLSDDSSSGHHHHHHHHHHHQQQPQQKQPQPQQKQQPQQGKRARRGGGSSRDPDPTATPPAAAAAAAAAMEEEEEMEPAMAMAMGMGKKETAIMSRREIHIYSERQRRKGMTHLYSLLHSLLPHANPKQTDRCTVLTEAMDYIYELQNRVEELEKQKSEVLTSMGAETGPGPGPGIGIGREAVPPSSSSSPSALVNAEVREELLAAADVVVRFCGADDAFITLNSPKRNGVWSSILQVLHENELELLNVTLSTSADVDYHCIHAKISTASEVRSHELQKMLQDVVLNHAILELC